MHSFPVIEGARGADMRQVFEDAQKCVDECDGVVILMERRSGGILWFAPNRMTLATLIYYLWAALNSLGK